MKKHEEDRKRAVYFCSVAKVDCERGFRAKTIYNSMMTTSLVCFQVKTAWEGEENVGDAACQLQSLSLVG